jgi:Family of unknown function (DUF5522)
MTFNKKIPIEEGDFYYSEEGYIVFTEQYHLKRGHCCQSGCKHCPYGFDKKTGKFKKEVDSTK